jgi:hypothetical protein
MLISLSARTFSFHFSKPCPPIFKTVPENFTAAPFDVSPDPHFGQGLPDFTSPPNITTFSQSLQISRAILLNLLFLFDNAGFVGIFQCYQSKI